MSAQEYADRIFNIFEQDIVSPFKHYFGTEDGLLEILVNVSDILEASIQLIERSERSKAARNPALRNPDMCRSNPSRWRTGPAVPAHDDFRVKMQSALVGVKKVFMDAGLIDEGSGERDSLAWSMLTALKVELEEAINVFPDFYRGERNPGDCTLHVSWPVRTNGDVDKRVIDAVRKFGGKYASTEQLNGKYMMEFTLPNKAKCSEAKGALRALEVRGLSTSMSY